MSPGASVPGDRMRLSGPEIYRKFLIVSIAANHILTSREPGRSIRFLVADCDTKVCGRLWNIIRAASETWCVQTTRSGREALQFIRTSHVDIAILNIDLPDLNGLEIQRTVWQESLRTDVIILIDTDSTETAVGAMKAGAQDVLVKPVNEDELFASIHESLDRLYPNVETLAIRMDVYLKEHASNPVLRRSDLCRQFNLSLAYVSRLFRNRLGTSFRNRLRYHRIERAKRMLRSTGDRMHVIAARCGFKNQSRLSEAFRKEAGMTPGQFRQISRAYWYR